MTTSFNENTTSEGDSTAGVGLAPLHSWLPHIVMYTLPDCGNCDRLKLIFKARKAPVVGISISVDDDVYPFLTETLLVTQTPVVLAHNIFGAPTYFSGFDSDRARIVIDSMRARLDLLENQGRLDPHSAQQYLADLVYNIAPGVRYPFIHPDTFVSMTTSYTADGSHPTERPAVPSLLPSSRDSVPPLLH